LLAAGHTGGIRPIRPAALDVSRRGEHAGGSEQTSHTGAPQQIQDELTLSPQAEEQADQQLSDEQRQQVLELQARDREVRQHEQAHLAAAGPYAKGGPKYTYQKGPDGRQYAVGGEVSIDTSPVDGDPEATIAKARIISQAASAPADPSSQDRAVAAAAGKMEAEARRELRRQQQEEQSGEGDPKRDLGIDVYA
jgi:hypothetical protein